MFSPSGAAAATAAPANTNAPAFRVTYAGATDPGRVRPHNEDRFGIWPEVGLCIVADGVGGNAAGEVAARMAVELVCEALIDPDVTWPRGSMKNGPGVPPLVDAIQRANHCILGAAQRKPACRGMATTIAALLACGHRAALAHVGDSRIYRFRNGGLTQLTEDHSLFAALVRAGRAAPDKPEAFAHHNIITRAVGSEEHVEIDARLVDAAVGDVFLLCSDGLSGVVEHAQIEAILNARGDLDEAAEALIAAANRNGGPDNVTAVLARWEPALMSWVRG